MHIAPSALESPGAPPIDHLLAPGQPQEQPPHGAPPSGPRGAPGGRRRKPNRIASLLLIAAVVAAASTAGVLVTAQRQIDKISRIEGLQFSAESDTIENYLLVGSDSRAGADPSDPDFGGIGSEESTGVTGQRSDTIMILRRDLESGQASLLSLPRDLWLYIPSRGGESRINAAFQDGPQALIDTVVQTLKIPVHHYVEIDFQGFKRLVDAIGGVTIGFWNPARDTHTGFYVATGGNHLLDGVQALAYARSRYYEEYVNGEWLPDPTSDLGRIRRQQAFINTALQAAIAKVKGNPLKVGDVLVSSTGALQLDDGLDVLDAAGAMRDAVADGLQTFSPPVYGKTVNGNAVLLFGDGAPAFIDFFAGTTDTPPPTTTG